MPQKQPSAETIKWVVGSDMLRWSIVVLLVLAALVIKGCQLITVKPTTAAFIEHAGAKTILLDEKKTEETIALHKNALSDAIAWPDSGYDLEWGPKGDDLEISVFEKTSGLGAERLVGTFFEKKDDKPKDRKEYLKIGRNMVLRFRYPNSDGVLKLALKRQ